MKVLQKDPELRTDEDLEMIHKYCAHMTFIEDLGMNNKKLLINSLRLMRIMRAFEGEVVFHHKSASNRYYIVLEGEVAIFPEKDASAWVKDLGLWKTAQNNGLTKEEFEV